MINARISDHLLKPTSARSYKNYSPRFFTADLVNNSRQLVSIFSVMVSTPNSTSLATFFNLAVTLMPLSEREVRNRPYSFVLSGIKELMKARDRLHKTLVWIKEWPLGDIWLLSLFSFTLTSFVFHYNFARLFEVTWPVPPPPQLWITLHFRITNTNLRVLNLSVIVFSLMLEMSN